MSKSFDPSFINPILTGIIEELLISGGELSYSQPLEITVKPIEEYEGRMRVSATEMFDVSVYIATTSFYLNHADIQAHRARGAMNIYVDSEVADKIFKTAGLQVPYDEDDESMLALCGNLCQSIVDAFKARLADAGYVNLETSTPAVYKNTITEGVEFSKDQDERQELSFYFKKHKALVLEWTLAPIPKK